MLLSVWRYIHYGNMFNLIFLFNIFFICIWMTYAAVSKELHRWIIGYSKKYIFLWSRYRSEYSDMHETLNCHFEVKKWILHLNTECSIDRFNFLVSITTLNECSSSESNRFSTFSAKHEMLMKSGQRSKFWTEIFLIHKIERKKINEENSAKLSI